MDSHGRGHVDAAPAGVPQAPGEINLVGVDEEVGVEVVDLAGGLAANEQRRRLAPVDIAGARTLALDRQQAVQEEGARQGRQGSWKAPGAGLGGSEAPGARIDP